MTNLVPCSSLSPPYSLTRDLCNIVILKGEVVRVGSHACLCPGRWADTLARCCTSFVNSGPVYERTYLAKLDGSYEMGECYLTVSLGEEYEDCSYKFIAAVIECDRR